MRKLAMIVGIFLVLIAISTMVSPLLTGVVNKAQDLLITVVALKVHDANQNYFRARMQTGQKIVDAIENYKREVGSPPASLTNLVPKYLATLPDGSKEYAGWYYVTTTNDSVVSYRCGFYSGGPQKIECVSGKWNVYVR